MALKPSLPKGTRDFLPDVMLRREYIINTIKEVFRKYGFLPVETPAMENTSTLTGKYGEEGDRLIFRILNSGDFLNKSDKDALEKNNSSAFANSISEKALRYDLTVPFARFVVQNQSELQFPFRRYQIQPVWRADRPQKGRFREFYQCDADVVGTTSLLADLEFVSMYEEVFNALRLPVTIKLNNRKILAGLAEALNLGDRFGSFTVILDKLDKIGIDGVTTEFQKHDFPITVVEAVNKIHQLKGDSKGQLNAIEEILTSSDQGKKGLEELLFILENSRCSNLKVDLTLARGLDYYTGSIFEVVADGVNLGSLGGGGRYDDLTGIFGKNDFSGIGISFGLDRIYLAMEEQSLFEDAVDDSTEVMFVNFGMNEALYAARLADDLRKLGVKVEVYPDSVKLKKQLDYANKRNISQVVLIGSEEMAKERFIIKEMNAGTQYELNRIELLKKFTKSTDAEEYGYH